MMRLPALGWGQVQASLVLQQRPPQELLVHSVAAAQSWPEDFFATQALVLPQ
ncbi:MAG TPA: hypothetical protein VGP07_14460 [Polyangia bacterium]